MVVIGVGTDVVRVGRIGEVCKRWGNRFLARLLHPEEHARLQTSPPPHPDTVLRFIAGRWAAKEAIFKAFGQSRGSLVFSQMLVTNEPSGKPRLILEGDAKRLATRLRIARTHLAISHEHDIAIAFAVAESE